MDESFKSLYIIIFNHSLTDEDGPDATLIFSTTRPIATAATTAGCLVIQY